MTANKKGPLNHVAKKNGKKGLAKQLLNNKTTGKYTIERTKSEIEELHETKGLLEFYNHRMYNTDSQIYRDLPKLTVKLESMLQDLRAKNDELTAKVEQLEILKGAIRRLFESIEVIR